MFKPNWLKSTSCPVTVRRTNFCRPRFFLDSTIRSFVLLRGPPPWEVVAADTRLEFDAATIIHIQFAQHYVGVACPRGLRLSHTGCPMWQGWPLTICGVETLQGEDVSVSCSGHIGSPSLIHLEVRHLLWHVSMAVLQVTLNHLQAPTHLFQLEAQMTQLSAVNLKLWCTAFIMVKWGGLKTTILFEIRFVSGEATCANVPLVYTRPSLTCSILQTVCRVEYYSIS